MPKTIELEIKKAVTSIKDITAYIVFIQLS